MKKWLFPSLMAVLVAACSVNAFAAIELTRTDLQYIRIKVDAIPTDPALPDIWLIQGNVIFLKDHYSLESIQLTLEADRLFLDFTVNRGDLIAGRDTVIDQPFAMKSEPLPQGLYTLVVRLNGQILFDRPLDTNPQPQPTPVPPVPVPFYRPIIEVVDAPVTDESLVSLLVRGYLPDTAHAITSAKAEVIGREILLHMEIESSGMGAEVLTMAEQVFPVGQLPAGDYYVLLIINGQPTEKSIFFVQSTTEPVVEPEPVSGPFFKPSVELKTNPVTIEDEVTLVVRGYLPDTAYFISRAHAEVQTNEVRLSMEIESSGIGAQVLVWTEQEFNLGKLPAGMYYAILMINGLGMAKTEFEVHATDPSSSVPEPNNNPYQAQILIDPVNPAVNEEFMIILKGWWPMEGYAIESKDVQVVDHDIFIKLTVFIPNIQTFAPTELVPFKEMLAALQLDYGIYTVHTSFFDQKVEPIRFWVGQPLRYEENEDSVISFRRDLAGETGTTWLNVDKQQLVNGVNSNFSSSDLMNYRIDPTRWNQLLAALEQADFSNLPPEFNNSLPPEQSNSFVITYKGKMVRIYEGAPIPAALNDAIVLLNQMAEDLYADGPSHVPAWDCY